MLKKFKSSTNAEKPGEMQVLAFGKTNIRMRTNSII
jgi:hypothetical protein